MQPIKLVCFDLDKTLVKETSWFKLNIAMGMTPEEDALFVKLYSEGIITFPEWVNINLRIFKKRDKATLENVNAVFSEVVYVPGAREAVEYVKSKGYEVALISGSVDVVVDKVARDLGIDFAEAVNVLIFDGDDKLDDIVNYGNDSLAKLRHLESFCRKLGIKITECACIGDGDNDIEMFEKTGHGITFKGSPIEDKAWKVINDLHDIKNIL